MKKEEEENNRREMRKTKNDKNLPKATKKKHTQLDPYGVWQRARNAT